MHLSQLQKLYLWWRRVILALKNTYLGRLIRSKLLENPHLKIPFQAIPLWIASVLTGLAAVGYEHLFTVFENWGKRLFQLDERLLFITAPFFFTLAWLVTKRFAPGARGSGIPQLMAAVDLAGTSRQHQISRLLSIRIALVKIFSSLILLLGGGAIGREGPTLQISGVVFETVYRHIPSSWERVSHRIMLITGGASGLAAAFNTPLGGIVYVIEELTRSHIARFRTAVFSAVIIAGMTAQNFLGAYLYLGYPRLSALPIGMIWAVLVLAFLSGFLGAAFTRLILFISSIRHFFRSTNAQFAFVLMLGFLFACLSYFAGSVSLGTGKTVINQILFEGADQVPLYSFPVRFLGAALSFSTGSGGGIFATSLTSGASLGALIVETLGLPEAHHNLLVLVSMIAFLTGVTRTPFTSAILVLEMTDRHSAIFYFLLAGITANLAAGFVMKKSFYEIQKDLFLKEMEQKNN